MGKMKVNIHRRKVLLYESSIFFNTLKDKKPHKKDKRRSVYIRFVLEVNELSQFCLCHICLLQHQSKMALPMKM